MISVRRKGMGFTLIELIVVMLIIALLVTLAVPKYFGSMQKSKDAVLKENLVLMRDALDKYYGDNGKYPDTLEDLISKKYLRSLPMDPIAGNATAWLIVPPDKPEKGGIFDIRSGAPGGARDGSEYKDW